MSCLECTDCIDIGTYDICSEEVLIGNADPSTEYIVMIKDLSLNSYIKQVVTTDANGDIFLTPDQFKFASNRTYEVKVYDSSDNSLSNPIDFDTDIAEDAQSCVSLDFFYTE